MTTPQRGQRHWQRLAGNVCGWMMSVAAAGVLLWNTAAAADPSPKDSSISRTRSRLTTVDGKSIAASLVGHQPPWSFRFATDAGQTAVAASDIVQFGSWQQATSGSQFLLTNGDLIIGHEPSLTHEQIVADSDVFDRLLLPATVVAAMVLNPPTDNTQHAELLASLSQHTGDADRLVLANGDQLTGKVTAIRDGKLHLMIPSGSTELPTTAVTAIAFQRIMASEPKSLAMLAGFEDGSRVTAQSLRFEGPNVVLTLAGGVELSFPLDTLRALQPVGGRAVYLSDLEAESYAHVPFLDLSWPYRRNQNVTGGPLTADGQVYLKGLGLHSASRLTYAVPTEATDFQAELAIDDHTKGKGSVVVRVYTDDGSGQWKSAYSSPTLRGGQPPLPLTLSLKGVNRISMLVDLADHGDVLDHADLLNARFIRREP